MKKAKGLFHSFSLYKFSSKRILVKRLMKLSPLPQPGDMHVELKKSGLLDRVKQPKFEFIPFRLLQENKQELCKNILSLEQEINDLRDQNSVLKRKLRKKTTPSTKPSSSSSTKET